MLSVKLPPLRVQPIKVTGVLHLMGVGLMRNALLGPETSGVY